MLALCAALMTPSCGAKSALPAPPAEADEPACGDGVRDLGEACDDGNQDDSDACLSTCERARCGDGEVHSGFEGCDDGNASATDGCLPSCKLATCGNGIVDAGEACDDGNDRDDDACTSRCLLARCGDGLVQSGVEACDDGLENGKLSRYRIEQAGLDQVVEPVSRAESAEAFYDYFSASSHTGFERARASRIYLYSDSTTGQLSVVVHHGIDAGESAEAQPKARVEQRFEGLPPDVFVAVADDADSEFEVIGEGFARGRWNFNRNTDGGVLTNFPPAGPWAFVVRADFEMGVENWAFVEAGGALVPLVPSEPLRVVAEADGCSAACELP